jgi:hypothetical protein
MPDHGNGDGDGDERRQPNTPTDPLLRGSAGTPRPPRELSGRQHTRGFLVHRERQCAAAKGPDIGCRHTSDTRCRWPSRRGMRAPGIRDTVTMTYRRASRRGMPPAVAMRDAAGGRDAGCRRNDTGHTDAGCPPRTGAPRAATPGGGWPQSRSAAYAVSVGGPAAAVRLDRVAVPEARVLLGSRRPARRMHEVRMAATGPYGGPGGRSYVRGGGGQEDGCELREL